MQKKINKRTGDTAEEREVTTPAILQQTLETSEATV
jgi:hypothetical protein